MLDDHSFTKQQEWYKTHINRMPYVCITPRSSRSTIKCVLNEYIRLDRSHMIYDLNNIKLGRYIDFHAPRPYEQYMSIIESIVENIPIN